MLKAKLTERGIPDLGPIVMANSFQPVGMLIVQLQSQALKVLKHFILAFQEENPRVTRIVINDDMIVFIWSNCPCCSVITVLTREYDAMIILP
jgi:hypothetical protein